MKRQYTWWCVSCRGLTELNKHGYCARCGSDAVDIVYRCKPTTYNEDKLPYQGEFGLEALDAIIDAT
jgi:rRNA maturation endonuclease Nob1